MNEQDVEYRRIYAESVQDVEGSQDLILTWVLSCTYVTLCN